MPGRDSGAQERGLPVGYLVLTDMVMPRVDGVALSERLKEISPRLEVVFMSGYPSASSGELPKDAEVLEKPFTPEQLIGYVDRILGDG